MATRRQQRAMELVSALVAGGTRLIRRGPGDLAGFLVALDTDEAGRVLATAEGRRDAWAHLGAGWEATVTVVAQPQSLPAVVERRTRVRVHPTAPWLTAGVAAGGSGAVVAGSAPGIVEVVGIAGVVVVTALGASLAWRPRASRSDRTYAVSGAEAVAARGQALLAQLSTPDPEAQRTTQRLHALVVGGADDVRAAEDAAAVAGLLDDSRRLVVPPQLPPAHAALVDEVVLQRAELVQSLLRLQHHVLRVDEHERHSRRSAYRRLLDDPLDDL